MQRTAKISLPSSPTIENTILAKTDENINYNNHILVILLIIASFFLGSLWTKVQYLEKNGTATLTAIQPTPATQGSKPARPPAGKIKLVTNNDHIRGNKDAKVTLVEYSDYECPFCKSFHPTLLEIMKTYGDKIRWVYRQYPLPFHTNAEKESEASECVAALGGNDTFWTFTDTLFERTTSNGTGFALTNLGPLAAEVGVDQTKFQNCLDANTYSKLVRDEITDGSTGGVTGTPSTFIIDTKGNSQLIVGAQPIETFKTAIDQALTK